MLKKNMSSGIVITGIGAVSPAGFGAKALWEALTHGQPLFKEIPLPLPKGRSRLGAAISGIDDFLGDRRFRRAANISKFTVAAIRLALQDAGLDPANWNGFEAGLVTAVTHGAISLTREFHEGLVTGGPAAASPVLFSDSVLNAPAGNASIAFNIRGASHTVVGDLSAGIMAVSTAIKTMRRGNIKVCIAGGAEELDPVVRGVYERLKLLSPQRGKEESMTPFADAHSGFIAGEGACFLTLEDKAAALNRKARIYAEISSVRNTLDGAGQLDTDADGEIIIMAGANGTYADVIEGRALQRLFEKSASVPRLCCIKPVIGESFAAAGMMQAAAAAMSIHNGFSLPSLTDGVKWARLNKTGEPVAIKTAVVSSAGFNDNGGILVLKAACK